MSKLKSYAAVAIMAVLLAACVSVPTPVQAAPEAPAQPPTAVPQAAARPTAEPALSRRLRQRPPRRETISTTTRVIQPQQVSINTQGLPYSWQANLVPATPYDTSQPPGPKGLPQHIEINFGVVDPKMQQSGDPIIYIIPVDAYRQMWDQAGNPSISNTISKIYTWTIAIQSPPPISGLPAQAAHLGLAARSGATGRAGRLTADSGDAEVRPPRCGLAMDRHNLRQTEPDRQSEECVRSYTVRTARCASRPTATMPAAGTPTPAAWWAMCG